MATTIDLSDDVAEPSQAPAVVESKNQLAVAGDLTAFGISGEVSQRDLVVPYLSVVQKSGTKADTFPVGSWVVGENKIADKDQPLRVVAIDVQKRFEEVVEYGSGAIGRIFESAKEVREAGLSLQRGASKEAREIAGILFWITAPEGAEEDLFPLVTEGGTRGTVAKYVARSSGYGGVAMPIFTAISPLGHLRGKHVSAGQWDLSATLTKSNGNSYYKVGLRPKGLTADDVLALIHSLGL